MKEKFLALIEELKSLGLAAKICAASNAAELRQIWETFVNENFGIVEEIKQWALEYTENENSNYIFAEGAEIEDPIEVAVFLCACEGTINECGICEIDGDFIEALNATEEKVAIAVADYVSSSYIDVITAEDIFADTDESEEGDSDVGEDSEEPSEGDCNNTGKMLEEDFISEEPGEDYGETGDDFRDIPE